ncbi:MAG: SCO family protein [Candidatus Hydrogenedentes bacterium]|nr:SCO family protein [Candidatus Hydrogenedentota bacterium]
MNYHHQNRVRYAVLLTTAAACCCAAGIAAAQSAGRGQMPGVQVDPFSFKGPDPAETYQDIYIEQNLDAQTPLDLAFNDEQGRRVRLGDLIKDRPVVLSLVYFECPMLCTRVLDGMVQAFDAGGLGLKLGRDYSAITVSIDPRETPELAAKKKANYLAQYGGDGGETGWHFLTGGEPEIEELAETVGFRYYYDESTKQYAHAAGIMILTPGGKVSSYMFGLEYLPRNLRLALVAAGEGRIGSLADKLTLLCYAYDPSKGAYGFYIMYALRLMGAAVVAALGLFWLLHYRGARREATRRAASGPDPALGGQRIPPPVQGG